MKIIIASTIVPFIEGGGTFIVDWLEQKLREYGHQVDVVKIPFSSYYIDLLSQIMALRLYHLEDACDRLICIRMPSYLLKHPEKYLWFIHHYREMYDLWDSEKAYLPKNSETKAIREYLIRADNIAFSESKQIYTNSLIVSRRLKDFNNITSEPLYPPILNPKQFFCNKYGDFIYYSSRINQIKRQLLAVEAMKYTKTDVKLLISGKSESPQYIEEIFNYIKKHSLKNKIKVLDAWITEEQKATFFSECLAALYIPYDEDSYGYPSLEAHHSRKAVITCTDSGGTDELIIHNKNGWLVEPEPDKLAEYFDQLYLNKQLAERMGVDGAERIVELGITWDNVIGKFTQ